MWEQSNRAAARARTDKKAEDKLWLRYNIVLGTDSVRFITQITWFSQMKAGWSLTRLYVQLKHVFKEDIPFCSSALVLALEVYL